MACKENDCEKKAHAQGYCNTHYYRARRRGLIEPLHSGKANLTIAEKFAIRYRVEANGCWIWKGGSDGHGYGFLLDERSRKLKAHRVSYVLYAGPIAEGLDVMHTCDTPACVNPAHLRLGTQAENMADKVAKGRHAFGERNGHARLTQEQVRSIRDDCGTGRRTQSELARLHGVDPSTISRAVNRHNWPSVE